MRKAFHSFVAALLLGFTAAAGAQTAVLGAKGQIAVGDKDYQSVASTLPATSVSPFTAVANSAIAQNHYFWPDGTDYWSAGPIYASQGQFIGDFTRTAIARPEYFTAAQIANVIVKFMALRNSHGEIPAAEYADNATTLF